MSQLRFAPLIRVSTEGQAQKGESLRTQKAQIAKYVQQLNGTVISWEYSGQEHATPDQERHKLDKLLRDSAKGIFDAVIVCDLSRWSRDNRRSKEGLEILKTSGIRFFVGPTEYDLHNPEQGLFVGLATEINEFHAKNQSLKSMQNRISRAQRGIPATGKIPYGRIWSEKDGWGIDSEKQQKIQYAAERYLAGESMAKISNLLEMNHSNLWKILTKRSGMDWEVRFQSAKLNIDENILIKVPALLSNETIDAIKSKGFCNKTFTHGQLKHEYLLGRMTFCAKCGNAMFGQTNHGNRRYYRHPRGRKEMCDPGLWVPAKQLEDAVMVNLFAMFGDIERLEKAVENATPDANQLEKLQSRLAAIGKELTKVAKKKELVIDAIADGILSKVDARAKMDGIREREALLNDERTRIESEVSALPDYRKRLSQLAQAVKRHCLSLAYRPESLGKMDYSAKRKVAQAAFGGKDSQGRRLGVYVWKENDVFHYDIRGIVPLENFEFTARNPILQGKLPMTKELAQHILGVDTDHSDFNPLCDDQAEVSNFALY